jgi:hypothetical protein
MTQLDDHSSELTLLDLDEVELVAGGAGYIMVDRRTDDGAPPPPPAAE